MTDCLGGDEPSFWFSVTRLSTGDVIFSSENTKLVFEDQFIEFVSHLPEDYNCRQTHFILAQEW